MTRTVQKYAASEAITLELCCQQCERKSLRGTIRLNLTLDEIGRRQNSVRSAEGTGESVRNVQRRSGRL